MFFAGSGVAVRYENACAPVADIVVVDFGCAVRNDFSVLIDYKLGGSTAGNLNAPAVSCCLAILIIEPCEKHAQTR